MKKLSKKASLEKSIFHAQKSRIAIIKNHLIDIKIRSFILDGHSIFILGPRGSILPRKLGKIDPLGPKMKISRPSKIELSYFNINKIVIFTVIVIFVSNLF